MHTVSCVHWPDCLYDDPITNDGSKMCLHDYCLVPEAAMNVNHVAQKTKKPYKVR